MQVGEGIGIKYMAKTLKQKPIKVLSLFDGISCARVALERAGIPVEVYYASEIDKYAIQISKKNWIDIFHIGDIKNIKYDNERMLPYGLGWGIGDNVPKGIDLLIGGSPCQDLSIAKKNRKGLSGERSSLFWEYVRILKEVKPKYFILENVNSMPKEAKDLITKTLGVEPIMINASLVSAQNRKRLFWTNIPNVTQPEDKGIFLKDILENGTVDRFKSYCIDANYWKGASWKQYKEKGRRQLVKLGDIFPSGAQAGRVYSSNGKSVALSALGGGSGAKTGLYVTKHTHETGAELEAIRKLTPIECERLQGLPDNYTEGVSNTQRYKCLGNAFNVDVVAHILSFIP